MSDRINTHKDLDVIKESFRLGNNIYQVTRKFPKEEIFGYFSYPSGIEDQIVSVRKMLRGLRKSITNKTIDHSSQITYHT